MASYRSSASFGKRLEFVAISELLLRGHDVYQTLVDDQGIDCIIRKVINEKPYYVDLQIKARSSDCKLGDAGRFAAMSIVDPRPNFIFMFYSGWLKTWWLMPSMTLVTLASRNKTGSNAGKYHILFSGLQKGKPTIKSKFDEYREEKGFEILDNTFYELAKNS